MVIKLGSLFDGIGGFPLAGVKFGFVPVWASEIEPWPIKVTEKHFPNMKHLGDITQINGAEIEPVDVITFGSPCFPAGTLILTEAGYRPIESVQIGDKVFTHKGNWKRVTDVGWKYSNTIILKGSHYGLELTPNHPIWSAETKKYYPTYSNGKRGNKRKLINVGEWTRADGMKGKRWAIPNSITGIKIPSITSCSNKANDAPQFNEDTFYFIGRWLGDGWLRDGQRPNRPDGQTWGQIFLCCSHDEAGNVEEMVKTVFPIATRLNERTVAKFRISNMSFAKWLKENFDEHAGQKTIPAWAYCMEDKYKQALLNGYIDSDGWDIRNGLKRATTVSVKLAHGIRLLAETLGYSTAVYKCEMPPSTTIEGRKVSQKTMYQIDINSNKRTNAIVTDTHNWYPVKKISPGREKVKVFNITVDDDCSYIAEGFVVHNCQDLSVAGKREGLAGERSGLFMEAVRIIREMRTATDGKYPRFAVWENVPGAFSSNKGQDFRAVLEEIGNAEIPMPKSGRWATAGMVRTETADIAWRVLDAQYWGVPQRRRRIFLVADFGGQCAGEILFVEEGLSGYPAESGKAREEAATTVGDGIETAIPINTMTAQGRPSDKGRMGSGIGKPGDPANTISAAHCHAVLTESEVAREEVTGIGEANKQLYAIFDPYNNAVSDNCTSLGSNCGMSTGRSIVMREVSRTLRAEAGAPKHEADWESLIIEPRSQGREAGQKAAAGAGDGVEKSSECLMFENHGQDTRFKGPLDIAQPVTATFGMGGNNQPFVVHKSSYWDGGQMMPEKRRFPVVIEPRSQDGVCRIHDDGIVPTLNTAQGGQRQPCVLAFTQNQRDEIRDLNDKAGALAAKPGMKQQTFIYGICSDSSNSMKSSNPHSGIYKADTTRTLDLNGGNPACNQGGMAIVEPMKDCTPEGISGTVTCKWAKGSGGPSGNEYGNLIIKPYSIQGSMIGRQDKNGPQGDGINEDVSFTLNATDRHAVAFQPGNLSRQAGADPSETVFPTLGATTLGDQFPHVSVGYAVRRLTPTECLRLQGFPDYWLDIDGMSDTQKYKAVGNSVAIPCVDFVLGGIAKALREGE